MQARLDSCSACFVDTFARCPTLGGVKRLLAERFLLIAVSAGLPCLPAARGQGSAPPGERRTPRGASSDSIATGEPRSVLDCLPSDAAAVFFADSPDRFVRNPLIAAAVPYGKELPRVRAALAPILDGPVALALMPEAGQPARFVPLVAAKLRAGVEDPMKRLREALPKAINGSVLAEAAGACTAASNDDGSVTLKFERYPDVFVARRGDVVIAATDPLFVAAFQTGRELQHSLAVRPEVACGLRPVEGSVPTESHSYRPASEEARANATAPLALCHVNLKRVETGYGALLPCWPRALNPVFNSVALESFALFEYSDRFKVSFVRVRSMHPVFRFISGATNSRTLAEYFPPEATFMVSGALSASPDWGEILRTVTEGDYLPPIAEGARMMLAALSGIEVPPALLPLPSGRWAFGGRIESEGQITAGLLAVALLDAAGFRRELEEYRKKPESKLITNVVENVTIDHWRASDRWPTSGGRIYSTMVLDDVLLIADEPHTLVAVLEARENHRTLDTSRFYPKLAERLQREHALLASVELETLFRSMPMSWHSKLDPAWRRLARNHPSILLAATPIQDGACMDFVSAPSSKAGWSDAWEASAAEFEPMRAQARRCKSAYTVKNIATAMLIYANDHDGAGPPSLQALLGGGQLQASALSCPYPELASKAVADGPFYLLRSLPNLASLRELKESSTTVMAGERMIHDGGANFAFADGHVEWVESPQAEELLRQLTGRE